MELISFPFRVNNNGEVVKHEQNSVPQLSEELAVLMTTIVGERILAPGFGITDPIYSTINEAELKVKTKIFDIPVKIKELSVIFPREGEQKITVEFDTKLDRGGNGR